MKIKTLIPKQTSRMEIKTLIPKQVKVGAYDYKVTPRDKDWEKIHQVYGLCHTKHLTIDIAVEDIEPIFILDTLIHEINHALWYWFNLGEDSGEEKVVTLLSSGWAAVLRDNPELVKFQNKVLKALNEK